MSRCRTRILIFAAVLGLGACATGGTGESQQLVVRGALMSKTAAPMPPDGVAVVELREGSASDGRVVAEQRIDLQGRQPPLPFALAVDRAKLAPGARYAVRGGVLERGRPAWVSDGVAVDVAASAIDVGTLEMTVVRTGAFATMYRCGDQEAVIDYTQHSMRLRVGEELYTLSLRPVRTADGAKYEAVGDPTTWFWSKGRGGTLSVKGRTYPDCVTAGEGAARPVRARGNEPGWIADIDGDRLTLLTDNGTRKLVARTSAPQVAGDTRRYTASTERGPIVLTVSERLCRDNMSGMPYPATAELTLEGRTLRGCAGEPVDLLHGPEWVVEDLGGGGIIDRSRATLDFGADGRVSGRASCNTYTGRYALSGEGMKVSDIAVTDKACAPSLMQQEQKFLAILRDAASFDFSADGALVLKAADGRTILARR